MPTVQIQEATAFEQHTREVLDDLRELRSALIDIETAGRGYALTGDRPFLGPYRAALPRAIAVMNKLQGEVRNPEIKAAVAELRKLVIAKIEITERRGRARGGGGGARRGRGRRRGGGEAV